MHTANINSLIIMLPSNLKTIDTALCETIVQSTSINSTLMGPMNYPVG